MREKTTTETILEHIEDIIKLLDEDAKISEDYSIIEELAYQMKEELEIINN